MNSIIDYLEHWTRVQPDKCFSSFLNVHGEEIETYTYSSFNQRSRHLAEYLFRQVGIKRGDRVLLVYPPGLEAIVSFVACARIGAIPVPVCPPTPGNFRGALAKLAFVSQDCQARVALTTGEFYRSYRGFLQNLQASSLSESTPYLPNIAWVITDEARVQASEGFYDDPGSILFLQYTSGSTGDPKGVIVSHENVIRNCRATTDHVPTAVCWLPQYHDMGLIGYYVFLVITGGTTYGFSPTDFLKRPVLWLQTLSRVRATYTSSPNFGFEYCLREDKIPEDQLSDIDLSSVRVLMNGSEPVRAETYRRFLERFGPYGLQPEAHVAAYGLAENTLAVTNYGRRMLSVNKRLLQQGTLRIENPDLPNNNQLPLVSCGRPLDGIHVRIVDPESRAVVGSRQIGEIWLAGASTCQGYWNRPELTHETFCNAVANDPEDHNAYLRSGDLGFLEDGELFVCGRIKDLIIIRGVNYYPQDIERIVESTSQKVQAGCVAAFQGNEDEENLVIVVGVRTAKDLPDSAKISHTLRTHYYIGPHTIVFAPMRSIVKTTSGKIARSLIRERWLRGELPTFETYINVRNNEIKRDLPSGLRARLQYILKPHNLTGQEEYTLAEAGIDSLTMVELLLEIEQLLEKHGTFELVQEIDGRFLQQLTVAEFFSLINQLEKGPGEAMVALQVVLKKLKQENGEHEEDRMRRDAKLESINCVHLPENQEPLTSVLLTGPTGFFGPFLLSSLLMQTPYEYYVLTRGADCSSGMDRVRDSLRSARLLTPDLNDALEKRVHIVCGDVSQPNLGVRWGLWKSLTTQVQAVIHNAALVNYVLNYQALKPHNVDGTRELLKFSCTGTKKEFHFISSTVIFGWTPKAELLETEDNEEMLNLDFGYAQSKWVAEQLVFAAEKQGLDVRIYRPSFISASTRGIASKDDIVIRLLAFMINHGIAPSARNQISLLPADLAANNIAAIFKQRQTDGQTFHVTVNGYYNLIDITRLITREYGYPFLYYEIPTFVAEMKRHCVRQDSIYPLLDFFSRSHHKIAAMQHKRYNNSQYREAIQRCGFDFVDPLLNETVSYLMAYMRQERII